MEKLSETFLALRDYKYFPASLQIGAVTLCYLTTVYVMHLEYSLHGNVWGYPLTMSMLFAPIIEEVLFRGLLLKDFISRYKLHTAVILSSVLFGLWHYKSIFWLPQHEVFMQMLYTGCVFAPIAAYITIKCRSIWPVVILHFIHNLVVSGSVLLFLRALG